MPRPPQFVGGPCASRAWAVSGGGVKRAIVTGPGLTVKVAGTSRVPNMPGAPWPAVDGGDVAGTAAPCGNR